jgi:hypothetical protein
MNSLHFYRLLTFEYNDMGLWKLRPLKTVIDMLRSHGYICYYDGSPNLTRVTGCWQHVYDTRSWSNLVCAANGTWLLHMLEEQSFLKTHGML